MRVEPDSEKVVFQKGELLITRQRNVSSDVIAPVVLVLVHKP